MVVCVVFVSGCASPPRPGTASPRLGDEIVVAGTFIHTGTPVVLWFDPGGYDAYRIERRFVTHEHASWEASQGRLASPHRFGHRRIGGEVLPPHEATVEVLGGVIDQFVLHYDVCGTSRRCFQVLHDIRGLSVHFLLDIDGTIYQTLDVKERAWHATIANDRSVGIEIAHIGAYPPGRASPLDAWYARDGGGWRITIPDDQGDGGVRTAGFVGRPRSDGFVTGEIHGQRLIQPDFTAEQYRALAHLLAALHGSLPEIRLEAPRGPDGRVLTRALTPDEWASFKGVLGHFHVQTNKIDPGPAFDWEWVLGESRRLAGRKR